MKRMVFCFISLLVMIMGCASSGSAVAETNSPGMDLDAAIREAATQMGENLPVKTQVALVNVASSSAQLSEYVISRLEAALVGGKKLVVVDRANLDKIRAEQGFQLSGEVDDNSAKAIGKLLGAGAIVTGGFANLGDVYSLTIKAINIETATVAVSYPADIAKSTRIETLLASGGGGAGTQTAQRVTAGGGTPVQAQSTPVPAEPARVYQIGDTGPAGGIVFYDKGNDSGGWRYMEVGPAAADREVTRTLPGERSFGRAGNSRIGAGKSNTEIMVGILDRSGGGVNTAYWICYNLSLNGYDDWFLPSLDELLILYNFYNEYNFDGFHTAKYWSSTHTEQGYVLVVDFRNGQEGTISSGTGTRVRAIRQF